MMPFHCYELGYELAFPACMHDRYEIESDVSGGITFSFGTAGCATDLSGVLSGAARRSGAILSSLPIVGLTHEDVG